jgi:hypothetical protein
MPFVASAPAHGNPYGRAVPLRLAMDWQRGPGFVFLCLLAAAFALALLTVFFIVGDFDSTPASQRAKDLTVAVVVAGAIGLLAFAWRQRFDLLGEGAGLLGLFLLVLIGYTDPTPAAWEVLPAFLLPWALLVVELPNRHRIVLLVAQWLASAMLLEVWAGETATTILFGLGLAHVAAVWATLPEGPLRRVPIAVGALIVATTFGAALWFTLQEPTARRFAFLAVCVGLFAAFAFVVRSGHLRALRMPTLLRA